MIDKLRKEIGISSLSELEMDLWTMMREEFAKMLSSLLEKIDQAIFELRDPGRYASDGFVTRTMGTMFGQDVSFRRRRYRDCDTGKDVYLLDELLGIERESQVSPALTSLMLTQAATTNSYRKAAESIAGFLGFRAVSHETVRQTVIRVGKELERVSAEQRAEPQGNRKVRVLFVEADGMSVPLQKSKKRRVEEKIVTFHEGWQPRYAGSKDYKLKCLRQFRSHQAEDFWEEASRAVYSHYDVDENTVVVINGDRAHWIRKGVDYFPNAMYQVDRFHLLRDLKLWFGKHSKTYRRLVSALDSNDPTGIEFLGRLVKAVDKLEGSKYKEALSLIEDLAGMPEAVVDYRIRLRAQGVSTQGFQGLGAAESQVKRFSDRIKGPRSWRPNGLSAMMELQRTRHEGIFYEIVSRLEQWITSESNPSLPVQDAVCSAVRSAAAKMANALNAKVPIKNMGRTGSGGLSHFFHRLNESGMSPITNF